MKPLPPIISRTDAHQQGKTQYFTGEPCKHGHIAPRFVCNGGCLSCANKRTLRRSPYSPDKVVYNFEGWRSRRLTPAQLQELTEYLRLALETYEAAVLPTLCGQCKGVGQLPAGDGTNRWVPCPGCQL